MDGVSAVLAGLYLLRRGRLGIRPVFLSLVHLARYRLHRADYYEILRDGLAPWIGCSREELRAVSRECFEAVVRERLYEEGVDLLRRYREAGSRVALLSSTSPFILEEVRRHLRCDDALATEFAFEDGVLTRRMVGPAVFGQGKVLKAREHARHHGAVLDACAFYSDNVTDLPLLEAVGHPFVVNPDGGLRRVALARGWPVLWFERAARARSRGVTGRR